MTAQKAQLSILTINIVKVGMVVYSDTSVIVGWQRNKMIDNSDVVNIVSNGTQVSEVAVDHIFQKDTI